MSSPLGAGWVLRRNEALGGRAAICQQAEYPDAEQLRRRGALGLLRKGKTTTMETEPDRTRQNQAEPDRTRQNQTEPGRTRQNQAELDRTRENQAELDRTRQN
ncbi:hypothetical protein EYF80_067199 [Liparis tanakae]|uniref:Uncharacterized protein n=1 Tax=Liparis tanakae TaxID=230148 RepID=A0A4Z2E1E4_9TELE|nr:hypothetical protein EYF80_067199 [Liparis tanakae]